jgi:hypothetical protein
MPVSYAELGEVDPIYVDLLRDHESAVRRVLDQLGRPDPMRWTAITDGQGNQAFVLLAADGLRLAQVTPLDLTLPRGDFEHLLLDSREALSWTHF